MLNTKEVLINYEIFHYCNITLHKIILNLIRQRDLMLLLNYVI